MGKILRGIVTGGLVLAVPVLFGSMAVVVEYYGKGEGVDPLTFCALRLAVSSTLLLATGTLMEGFQLPDGPREWLALTLAGVTGSVLNSALYVCGIYAAGADVAAIMQQFTPLFTAALSVMVGAERVKPLEVHWWGKPMGMLIAVGGAMLTILWPVLSRAGSAVESPTAALGILMLTVQTLAMAVYVVGQRQLVFASGAVFHDRWAHKPTLLVAYAQFLGGLVLAVVQTPRAVMNPSVLAVPTNIYIPVLYGGFMIGFVVYWTMSFLSARVVPSVMVASWPLEPAVTILLSMLVFREFLTVGEWAGAGCVVVGVLLTACAGYIDERREAREAVAVACGDVRPCAELGAGRVEGCRQGACREGGGKTVANCAVGVRSDSSCCATTVETTALLSLNAHDGVLYLATAEAVADIV